jgi:hypothetical protein
MRVFSLAWASRILSWCRATISAHWLISGAVVDARRGGLTRQWFLSSTRCIKEDGEASSVMAPLGLWQAGLVPRWGDAATPSRSACMRRVV